VSEELAHFALQASELIEQIGVGATKQILEHGEHLLWRWANWRESRFAGSNFKSRPGVLKAGVFAGCVSRDLLP
jgi:hypothetical protein